MSQPGSWVGYYGNSDLVFLFLLVLRGSWRVKIFLYYWTENEETRWGMMLYQCLIPKAEGGMIRSCDYDRVPLCLRP